MPGYKPRTLVLIRHQRVNSRCSESQQNSSSIETVLVFSHHKKLYREKITCRCVWILCFFLCPKSQYFLHYYKDMRLFSSIWPPFSWRFSARSSPPSVMESAKAPVTYCYMGSEITPFWPHCDSLQTNKYWGEDTLQQLN